MSKALQCPYFSVSLSPVILQGPRQQRSLDFVIISGNIIVVYSLSKTRSKSFHYFLGLRSTSPSGVVTLGTFYLVRGVWDYPRLCSVHISAYDYPQLSCRTPSLPPSQLYSIGIPARSLRVITMLEKSVFSLYLRPDPSLGDELRDVSV